MGSGGGGGSASCRGFVRPDRQMDGQNEERGEEERHFHQDYPAAQNLIWESGPVLSEHTPTHRQAAWGGWGT